MTIVDTLRTAATAMLVNKLRSSLTVLGIVIGVAAVIGVMSIGEGAQRQITSRIAGLGTNVLFVRPGAATDQGVRQLQGTGTTLTAEDAQALVDPVRAPAIRLVAPEANANVQAVVGAENFRGRALGTTPEYAAIRNLTVAEGRFLSEQDVLGAATVAVIGSNVAETLFPDGPAAGEFVRINNRPFTVIGVLEPAGGTAQGLLDDIFILPLTTVQFRVAVQRTTRGVPSVQSINVQAVDSQRMAEAKAQVVGLLRERHETSEGTDDFTVTSQEELLEAFTQVADVLTIFLGSIAGISLMVGGIGIMNIMLVSVTERTREIGIRKAVGAKRTDILRQFLAEAVVLSGMGGALGVAVGFTLSRGFDRLTLNGQNITTVMTPETVGLAVGVAVAIGVFFGFYPALRASRLDPIEALRHE